VGVTIANTRVAADIDTAPYTQDITTADLGGLTPVAAIIEVTRAITDGVQADHYGFSIGAATGASNEWCASFSVEDGTAAADTAQITSSSKCIVLLVPGDTTVDGEAEFSAWITNGIRINWTNAPGAAFLIKVKFIAGTDVSAHANNISLGDSEDNAVDITAPAFEPDFMLAVCAGGLAIDSSGTSPRLSIGLIHNGDSTVQGCHAFLYGHAAGTGNPDGRTTATYGIMQITTVAALYAAGRNGALLNDGSGGHSL